MATNEELLQNFIRELDFDKSYATQKMDKMVLTTFNNYVKKPFTEVTKDDMIDFFNAMKTGKLKAKYGHYSNYTIELYKSQIKKFFKWLYDYETTQKIPEQVSWIKLNIKRAYKHKTKADILTEQEIEQLIMSAKTPRNRAIIAVLFDSACRISEFTNLNIGDVIEEGDEISICVDGKTGQRTIPLNYSTKYLLEYLSSHPYKQLRTAPLWLSNFKKRYSLNGIHQTVTSISKRSSVQKHVSCHILRHSRLTDLAKKGMNESQMRYFAGWSSSSTMPSIYLHLSGADIRNALYRIEPKKTFVDEDTIEQRVNERLTEERKKMQDEILQNLLETLKDPQHHAIQDFLFGQSEKP